MPLRRMNPVDALDLIEYWLFEPLERSYLEGHIKYDDYIDRREVVWRSVYIPPTPVLMVDGRTIVAPAWWDPAWDVSEPVDWLITTADDQLSLPPISAGRTPSAPRAASADPSAPEVPDESSARAAFDAFRLASETDQLPGRPDPVERAPSGLPPGWEE